MEHYVNKLRRIHIPTHIQIELTKQCNWRCKFCYAECDGSNGLSTAEIKKLIDQLKKAGTLEINFTGGEPLLRSDCFEIFEYAKNKGFSLTINTNGSLINEHNIDKMKKLFGHMEISLHSSKPEIHDELVQTKGAWEKTIHALTLLQDCKSKILVKCVLTADEVGDIDEMRKMISDMGYDFNIDFNITPTYSGSKNPLEYKLEDNQIKNLIEKDNSYIYRFRIDEIYEKFKVKKMSDGICRAGRNLAFIDSEGNVFPCITFKTSEGRLIYQGTDYLQNIKKLSFNDIWNNNEMFKIIRELEAKDFSKCLMCKYDCYCKKCIGVNFKETGEFVQPSIEYCIQADNMFSFLEG